MQWFVEIRRFLNGVVEPARSRLYRRKSRKIRALAQVVKWPSRIRIWTRRTEKAALSGDEKMPAVANSVRSVSLFIV